MPRHVLPLALLTLALAAGGCGDDPEPKIAGPTSGASLETETSSAPTSEPTAGESTTATPSEAPTPDSQADETATAWINALSTAFATGEFDDVEQLTGKGCSGCRDLIDPVRETFDQGGSYDAEPIEVLSVIPQDDPQVVQLEVEFPAGELTASAGARPEKFESSEGTLEFVVKTGPSGDDVVTSLQFLS